MQVLTEQSVLFLRIMLNEPDLLKELIDGKDQSYYSRIDINPETGSIVLGKTRFGWWNDLTGDKKVITLKDFAFTALGFLGARGKNEGHGDEITNGLMGDITDSLHRQGLSNNAIDRLFLVGYMVVKTSWSCLSLGAQGVQDKEETKINVNVSGKTYHKHFQLGNSGDTVVELEYSPTNVRVMGR